MDTQYTEEEYTKHVGWGHSSVESVVSLALDANVGKLVLFHHGELARTPSPRREQNYAAGKRQSHFPGNAEGDPFGAAHNYI